MELLVKPEMLTAYIYGPTFGNAETVSFYLLHNVSTLNQCREVSCGRPLRFAAHRQPLCWNFMYHSRIVLSVGGSVGYTVRNLRCTVTIDSVFGKFQATERFLIHCARHFSSGLPPSGGTCKYAKAPSTKKNFERFSTY